MSLLPEANDTLYVACFGPGYGESIVLRVPPNYWLVIDSCLENSICPAIQLLDEAEANSDLVLLSHPHLDHAQGIDRIIDEYTRADSTLACLDPRVYDPQKWVQSNNPSEHHSKGALEAAISAYMTAWDDEPEGKWEPYRADEKTFGDAKLTVVHPSKEVVSKLSESEKTDYNRLSSAISLDWMGNHLLLGGDVLTVDWQELEAEYPNLADHLVCKVPHHGSESSFACVWMKQVRKNRKWIVTPFHRIRLPRLDSDNQLLNHIEELCLTSSNTSSESNNEDRLQAYVVLEMNKEGKVTRLKLGDKATLVSKESPQLLSFQ